MRKKISGCNSGSKIFLSPSQLVLSNLINGDVSQVHSSGTFARDTEVELG